MSMQGYGFYSTHKFGDATKWYTTVGTNEVIVFEQTLGSDTRELTLTQISIFANATNLEIKLISRNGEEDSILDVVAGQTVSFTDCKFVSIKVLGAAGQQVKLNGIYN